MAQRVIFVNLHSNWMLVKNAAVFLFKNSAAVKHKYLLDYLLESSDYEVCNYINDRGFSLYTRGSDRLQRFLNLFSGLENRWILKKNGINPKKITILRHKEDIHHDDILIVYNLMQLNYRGLEDIDAFKVACLIHYGGQPGQYENIQKAGINCLMCEVNLEHTSELYRRYSPLHLPWVVHPFVAADRFIRIKPFAERETKAFSVGTITYKYEPEFLEIYGDPCDQPIRKLVKDNQEFFKETVDCFSQDYLEDSEGKTVNENDCKLKAFIKRVYNRTHTGQQKKYFSFDMVEKFNSYKMHIVGEEILGVPGIGFVEGMACGSVYIGIDSPMYRDLGLIPGVHYIAYDGTKEGLRSIINFWQQPENQQALAKIANDGYDFILHHCNKKHVAQDIMSQIFRIKEQDSSQI